VRDLLPKFRQMAAEAERDPATIPVTIWGAKEDEDMLKRDRDAGVVRVVVSLDSAKADVILPQLDRWAKLLQKAA
jgi:MoaA/NifB/PqqE/SkfB family radical SAM enzyme